MSGDASVSKETQESWDRQAAMMEWLAFHMDILEAGCRSRREREAKEKEDSHGG